MSWPPARSGYDTYHTFSHGSSTGCHNCRMVPASKRVSWDETVLLLICQCWWAQQWSYCPNKPTITSRLVILVPFACSVARKPLHSKLQRYLLWQSRYRPDFRVTIPDRRSHAYSTHSYPDPQILIGILIALSLGEITSLIRIPPIRNSQSTSWYGSATGG